MAEMDSLRELYVEELKDLWSAENQILKGLPRMIKAASHPQLKRAFTKHEAQTRMQVKRLERICKELGESPRGKKCVGMEGLIQEAKDLLSEKPEPNVLDAGLISAAQHVAHVGQAARLRRPRVAPPANTGRGEGDRSAAHRHRGVADQHRRRIGRGGGRRGVG